MRARIGGTPNSTVFAAAVSTGATLNSTRCVPSSARASSRLTRPCSMARRTGRSRRARAAAREAGSGVAGQRRARAGGASTAAAARSGVYSATAPSRAWRARPPRRAPRRRGASPCGGSTGRARPRTGRRRWAGRGLPPVASGRSAVDEVRVLVVHELEVRAPPRADRRQLHGHRLHVRPPPALAAGRQYERVRRGVEGRELVLLEVRADDLDPACVAGIAAERAADEQLELAAGPGDRLRSGLDHERHSVVDRELVQEGANQHVCALTLAPPEHREKDEPVEPELERPARRVEPLDRERRLDLLQSVGETPPRANVSRLKSLATQISSSGSSCAAHRQAASRSRTSSGDGQLHAGEAFEPGGHAV